MTSHRDIFVSCTTQECDNVTEHFIIQFPLYYLSSGRLWKVERKCSSESGRGRLREVVAYKRF